MTAVCCVQTMKLSTGIQPSEDSSIRCSTELAEVWVSTVRGLAAVQTIRTQEAEETLLLASQWLCALSKTTIYKKPSWVFTGRRRPDIDCPMKTSWWPDLDCVRHWQSKALARQSTRFLDPAQPTIIFSIPHIQPQHNHRVLKSTLSEWDTSPSQ